MDRRAFIAALALGLLAAPLGVLAQQAGKVARIGVLFGGSPGDPLAEAFNQGLRDLGYVEGRNVSIELKAAQAAARSLGVYLQAMKVERPDNLKAVFSDMRQKRAEALIVSSSPIFYQHRTRLVELAATHSLPTIYHQSEFVVGSGGLMSYGPDFHDLFRRAATYVDRILKGSKPGDLPVQQPTKFELVINLKTAKALGLTIPQTLLLRADQVIE